MLLVLSIAFWISFFASQFTLSVTRRAVVGLIFLPPMAITSYVAVVLLDGEWVEQLYGWACIVTGFFFSIMFLIFAASVVFLDHDFDLSGEEKAACFWYKSTGAFIFTFVGFQILRFS